MKEWGVTANRLNRWAALRHPPSPGNRVMLYDVVSSTQDVMKEWCRKVPSPPPGTVVIARQQTEGRGRMGKTWISPRDGGWWLSILLPPAGRPVGKPVGKPAGKEGTSMAWMWTLAAAVALCRVLDRYYGLPARLKFPNDVLLAKKKLAGFLLESQRRPSRLVLGAGINLFQSRRELNRTLGPWSTSLTLEYRRPFSPFHLLTRYLDELGGLMREHRKHPDNVVEQAREYAWFSSDAAAIRTPRRRLKGWVRDFSARRGLLLQTMDGTQRFIAWDEVISLTYETPEPPLSV